jgi:hypothetical protein
MAARKPSLAELRAVAEHAALRVALYRRRTYFGGAASRGAWPSSSASPRARLTDCAAHEERIRRRHTDANHDEKSLLGARRRAAG